MQTIYSRKLRHIWNLSDIDKIFRVFVDFGHSKCTIGVSCFQKSFFQVIERFTDRFCGGRDLDLIIVNYFLPGELAPGRSETSALSQRRKDEETQCDHIL